MHLQDVQIQCHLPWDNCGCEFFFTILHFPFKSCTINNKDILKPNLLIQKQNCPFIFSKYWWQIAQLAKQSSPSQKLSCTAMCHGWLQHSFLPHTLSPETHYHKSPWRNLNTDPNNKLIMVILMAMGHNWRWNQNSVMIISATRKTKTNSDFIIEKKSKNGLKISSG